MRSKKDLSDAEVAEFTSRLRAVFSERKGKSLAEAAGVSYSALAHTVEGKYRPGSTVVSKVNAVLSSAAWDQSTTSVGVVVRAAISVDAECKRLRAELDAAEARVRAAVVAMLGGAS